MMCLATAMHNLKRLEIIETKHLQIFMFKQWFHSQ